MITVDKYYEQIKAQGVTRNRLPAILQKGWDYFNEATRKGKSYKLYQESDDVKRTIDLYIKKLNQHLAKKSKPPTQSPRKSTSTNAKPPQQESKKVEPSVTKKDTANPTSVPKVVRKVELISDELKFIRRYVNLHDKAKTKNQVRLFLNALQRAIVEKRIRKSSPHAKEIALIQYSLITLMGRFKKENVIQVAIPQKTRVRMLGILGRQEELLSVKFIKSYLRLQGNPIPVKKAKSLHNRIARKINSGALNSKDRYWSQIKSIIDHLRKFVQDNPVGGELIIERRELNGLNGVISEDPVKANKDTHTRIPDDAIMSSVDVLKLKFEKINLKGKWLDLIGNPSKDFTVMIYGKPKMGKSIMAVDFAGYLARNHGPVLYVAREEGIDDTLKEKLQKAAHRELYVTGSLPDDLGAYDFIFLDSVNKLALSPADLEAIKHRNPDKAFIYIFQTTKGGNFRGSNSFQHDVDVVIEVPEKGKAVQYGRFNQGGEMNIFNNAEAGQHN